MFSPIRTVLLHYPLRSLFTIVIMLAFCVCAFRYIRKKFDRGMISKERGIALWLLATYVMLLLFFTVIGRRSWDYYRYNVEPGYSYIEVFSTGDRDLAVQIIANIIIFIPVGFMSSYLSKHFGFIKGILCGSLISLSIEVLQLILKRGCCEIDDLISNLIGTILGCLIITIYRLEKSVKVRRGYEFKRSKEHY